jgi:predicted nuclease of predicted toxin-antitoxin system
MEIWLDAQISPHLATWVQVEFGIICFSLRHLNMRDAKDLQVFSSAKDKGNVIIITKDEDFCELLNRLGAPPQIIWFTIGNCSNEVMKKILQKELPLALSFLQDNDLVEISN